MADRAFIFVILAIIVGFHGYRFLIRRQRLAMNFRWYTSTHPQCFESSRVTCNACGSDRIHVRNLMRGWYLREHVCIQCGKALYWSPEDN